MTATSPAVTVPDGLDRHLDTVLELSTRHLDEHEMALLTRIGTHVPARRYGEVAAPHGDADLPRVIAHEYGAIVMVSPDPDDHLERMAHLHLNGLAACYAAASAAGVRMIDFDADNDPCDSLPTFDW